MRQMIRLPRIALKKRLFCNLVLLMLLASFIPANTVTAAPPMVKDSDTPPANVIDLWKGSSSSSPEYLTFVGTTLFFSAVDGNYGRELWKLPSPYTKAELVKDINPGYLSSDVKYIKGFGNLVFFSAKDDAGIELWVSEPPYNASSTRRVADLNENGDSDPANFVMIGNAVFFTADDGQHGREIFRTSPPYQSIDLVADIWPGAHGSNPRELTRLGWMLFYIAGDSTGTEIWRSDPEYTPGTAIKCTNIAKNGDAEVYDLTLVDNTIFFSANDGESGHELYKLEPPYGGAVRVTDIIGDPPENLLIYTINDTQPDWITAIGSYVFFSGNIGYSGNELYISKPPYEPTSTFIVDDIFDGFGSSNPRNLTAVGTTLFFTANEGIAGTELWKSVPPYDADHTNIVADISEGKGASDPRQLTAIGTTLFFTADDGVYGRELYMSEPPYEEYTTIRVADLYSGWRTSNPHSFAAIDRTLFFSATDGKIGAEIWKVDGNFFMPATGFAPNRITAIKPQPIERQYQDMNGIRLSIPNLRVQTDVVGVLPSNKGWDLTWLWNQAGYLQGTAFPTYDGNSVITAHVSLPNGKPGPFANLSSLKFDDPIEIHAWGNSYIYRVRSVERVTPDDRSAFRHEEGSWITLITCQGFDEASGEYLWRTVIRAALVEVIPES
jgi:LPXTG-site transpeptidase (sortase) family protein